jgi:hypothetical protein
MLLVLARQHGDPGDGQFDEAPARRRRRGALLLEEVGVKRAFAAGSS